MHNLSYSTKVSHLQVQRNGHLISCFQPPSITDKNQPGNERKHKAPVKYHDVVRGFIRESLDEGRQGGVVGSETAEAIEFAAALSDDLLDPLHSLGGLLGRED